MPPNDPDLPAAWPAPRPVSALAPLERRVVALALHDPLWSVPRPRRWLRSAASRGRHLHLANARLEALRRFVVLRRHGCPPGAHQGTDDLLEAGFSPGQIREALALTGLVGR